MRKKYSVVQQEYGFRTTKQIKEGVDKVRIIEPFYNNYYSKVTQVKTKVKIVRNENWMKQ